MENTSEFGAVADRNLLFGILALQMDFISKEALIAAMSAWVLAKSKPLGQLLVEQGALAGDRQALLETRSMNHLEQAVRKGFKDRDQLNQEPFKVLQNREDFRKLREKIQKGG